MDTVVIYGPPGVGKLTVARELARKTGYKLLHVHMIADLVASLFPFGSKEVRPLMEKFRLELLKAALKSGKIKGVILTGVYEPRGRVDLSGAVLRRISAVSHGRLRLVQLKCDERALFKRVGNGSRKAFGKITRRGDLEILMKKYDFHTAVRRPPSLVIDNTELSAPACAALIKSFYKL